MSEPNSIPIPQIPGPQIPGPKITGLKGSKGLKLILICALTLLMAIPVMFIAGISFERANRADDVVREVSETYGGEQIVSGPVLSVPYQQKRITRVDDRPREMIVTGHYAIFPETGVADLGDIQSEIRERSLFKVPTFTASGKLSATFPKRDDIDVPKGIILDWSQAQIVMSVSDVRGLTSDIIARNTAGQTRTFEPARAASGHAEAVRENMVDYVQRDDFGNLTPGVPLGIPVGDWLTSNPSLSLDIDLSLGGAARLGVTPFAKSTTIRMKSDWADPGFTGKFPPTDREITADGFTAEWSVPFLRRGIPAHGKASEVSNTLQANAVQVRFVITNSPYKTVNRALKYSVLFIGMVFLTYFLFEVIVGRRVHPAQYILVGLAQAIFYLLLLAFSERFGFTPSFIGSALATIAVTAGYGASVFGGRAYALRLAAVMAAVYGLLYVLMRLDDFALMVGALASFVAVAMTMYLTRNMNWYATPPSDVSG